MSSHSSHHPQDVILAQFCLYVDKGGLKPDSFHCDNWRDENVTVLKMVAMPIALAYLVALVRFGNDQILCLKTDATSFKADNHVTNSSYIVQATVLVVFGDLFVRLSVFAMVHALASLWDRMTKK